MGTGNQQPSGSKPDSQPDLSSNKPDIGRGNPTLLDAVFIVLTSATILVFLLWIVTSLAGQKQFDQLPSWLTAAASKLWAKLSLLGGSAGIFVLRKVVDKSPSPNYLLWIPGFVTFLLAISFGVWFLVHMIMPPTAPSASTLVHIPMRFRLDKTRDPGLVGDDIPDIKVWAESPEATNPVGLFRGTDPMYPYSDAFDFDHVQHSTAYIKMVVSGSHKEGAGKDYDYGICLDLNSAQPKTAGAPRAMLECTKGTCAPAPHDDPGYVVVGGDCAAKGASSAPGIIPVTYAAERQETTRAAGWVVPSLETLSKMTDRERVGYTQFQLYFTPNASLASADQYYFSLHVNGTPVYIDGLLPERTRYNLQTASPNQIAFALENLNFSGQYSGYEKLQLSLFFLQHGKVIRQQDVQRDYIALRPAPEVSTSNEAGTFTWKGDYITPKNENKYEILLASAVCGNPPNKACVDHAVYAKTMFDKDGMQFNQMPVVMVVRPPLPARKVPSYGLALGLVQPTSQVQFTFNADDAAQLCHWAAGHAGEGKGGKLIRPDLNRYEVATRGYQRCQ